jgi:CelD/BcsL family acetyltransferase involved in cellulose biosynthesis
VSANPGDAASLDWTLATSAPTPDEWRDWDAFNTALWDTPMLSSALLERALASFGDGGERLAVARRGAEVVAMALLASTRGGVASAFRVSQLPLCPWMQRDPVALPALASALLAHLPGRPAVLELPQMDPAKVPRPAMHRHIDTVDYIETGRVELPDEHAAFVAQRSSKFVANVRRRLRNAEAQHGQVTLRLAGDAASMPDWIDAYSRIESAGWKAQAGTAVLPGGDQHRFYRDLMAGFAAAGVARVYALRFGEAVVAIQLAVQRGARLYLLKTTYDEAFASLSPGVLLKWKIFEACCADPAGARRVDFYGPLLEAQKPWVASTRVLYHANVHRSAFAAQLRATARALRPARDAAPPVEPPPCRVDDAADGAPGADASPADGDLFNAPAWFDLLRRTAAPPDARLVVLRAKNDAFALPLARRGAALESFANFYTPLYEPAAGDAATPGAAALAAFAADPRQRISALDIWPLDGDGPFCHALAAGLAARGWWVDRYFRFGNWYLETGGRDFEAYFATRPSEVRKNRARRRRRLEERGLSIEIVRDLSPALDPAIRDFERIYAHSWRARSEPFPDFIGALCRLGAAHGWLRLGVLRLEGEAVAAQVWLVKDGVASIFKLAYLESHGKLSVGTVLTTELMRIAIDEDRVRVIDYLAGDDAYKRAWMSHRRERVGVVAFNPRRVGGALAGLRHFGGRIARAAWLAARGEAGDAPR